MNYEFCEGMTHTIKKGDTLYSISRQHNVPIAMLRRANPYVDVYNLQVGETICVPVDTGSRQGRTPDIVPLRQNTSTNMTTQPNQGMTTQPNMQPGSQTNPEMMMQPGNQANPGMTQQPMTKEDNTDINESDMDGNWVRYVTQAGDTLQDIMNMSEGDERDFWMKNSADKMYMLPGIAYYIYED